MKLFSFTKRLKWADFLLGIFIVLLLIPQTGQPIRIGINRIKTMVWSPSIEPADKQVRIPAFEYRLRNLDLEPVSLGIGQGRITFLSFWATWCAPCVAELPSIEALYQEYGDDINFILISREEPSVVQSFLKIKNTGVPSYSPISHVPDILQSTSIPTTFLIDGEGKILIKETGPANWNSKKVRALLDRLRQ